MYSINDLWTKVKLINSLTGNGETFSSWNPINTFIGLSRPYILKQALQTIQQDRLGNVRNATHCLKLEYYTFGKFNGFRLWSAQVNNCNNDNGIYNQRDVDKPYLHMM